jgi:hypothetical protein
MNKNYIFKDESSVKKGTQDEDKLRALVNVVMNIKCGEFLE